MNQKQQYQTKRNILTHIAVRFIFCVFSIVLGFGWLSSTTYAQNIPQNLNLQMSGIGAIPKTDSRFQSDFVSKLEKNNIGINDIQTKSTISRYELTRLLNLAECTDCLLPPPWMIRRYTMTFWDSFNALPGKDFRDVSYKGGLRNNQSYYYCVSYVGENEYMRGYPADSSPVCAGGFCGGKDVTKAEFIQVIINIVAKYIYSDYSADRSKIKYRSDNLSQTSYAYSVLDDNDRQILTNASIACPSIVCPMKSANQLKTYLKYCMFNLEECGFKSFGRIKSSYRPVSELNIMQRENLFPFDSSPEKNIHNPIDGSYVLSVVGQLNKKINCVFDQDYDCDGLTNYVDNCQNVYNPSQNDLDKDGIGDTCDSDIDGNGTQNTVGLVDDNGNIILSRYLNSEDQNQNATQNNNTGTNTIQKSGNIAFLDNKTVAPTQFTNDIGIYVSNKYDNISNSFEFTANTAGKHNGIKRDFGDGESGFGDQISHTYAKYGTYDVTAIAIGGTRNAIAKTTVNIPKLQKKTIGLQILSDNLSSYIPFGLSSSASDSDTNLINRIINNEDKFIGNSDQKFVYTIDKPGIYSIGAKINDLANNILAYSQRTTEIGFVINRGSMLNTDQIVIQIGDTVSLKTTNQNWKTSEIKNIQRNFGDGEITNNKNLVITKKYNSDGPKIIVQTIYFVDGAIHTNSLTIFVKPTIEDTKNDLTIGTDKLLLSKGEESVFNIDFSGIDTKNIIEIILNFGDGQSKILSPNQNAQQVKYTYSQIGSYNPYITISTKDCKTYITQMSLVISDYSTCLADYLDGTLSTKYKCDIDGDKIPDICDDDIDGDGVSNPIGLIKFENPDCSIMIDGIDLRYPGDLKLLKNNISNDQLDKQTGTNNINITASDNNVGKLKAVGKDNVDINLLLESINTCSFDDCFCLIGEVQKEIQRGNLINQNGQISINTGNTEALAVRTKTMEDFERICGDKIKSIIGNNVNTNTKDNTTKTGNNTRIDSDGDGYYDDEDGCPFLAENYNTQTDEDGCPEFSPTICPKSKLDFNIGKIQIGQCNQCPCQFLDFGGQLVVGDEVRAVLMNPFGSKAYTNSFTQKVE